MKPAVRVAIALPLLAAGVAIWWFFGGRTGFTPTRLALLAAAAAVALIPPARDALARALDRLRHPSPAARRWTAVAIAVAASGYLYFTAASQGREFIPKYHDEHMHILQVQHLARGKLWMQQHELADHFETFHVFVRPVYASIYFPGAALMYVPLVWLKLPMWVGPLVVSGVIVGLMYRVTTELIDGVAGLLAALMLLGLTLLRYLSIIVMSHTNRVLLGLLLVWALLHWRRSKSLAWAAAIGAIAGWAAITRPVDAICYAAPVGLAMLLDLRPLPWKRWAQTAACVVLAAAPFLSLQIIENVGVTGKPLMTPYRAYADLFTPQMSFGFHEFNPHMRPMTNLPQRQIYYYAFTVPAAKEHRADRIVDTWLTGRFPVLARRTTPNAALIALLPLSLLALDRRRWVLWSVLPVYIAFYAVFAYLLPHYVVVVAPAVVCGILLGKHALEHRLTEGRPRAAAAASTFLTLSVGALALTGYPEINADANDTWYGSPTPDMTISLIELPRAIKEPAIVLFRFTPGDSVHAEPVYNTDVAWPDDAPIIRAPDLGPQKNVELFEYYAKRQPHRAVYLLDRRSRQLTRLGNVVDLAKNPPMTTTKPTTTTAPAPAPQ